MRYSQIGQSVAEFYTAHTRHLSLNTLFLVVFPSSFTLHWFNASDLRWNKIDKTRCRGLSNPPTITLIAAMAKERVIGMKNGLPWELPADMRHFRQQTMGKPILMGRKTFDSIGRPLPGRQNIVITRDQQLQIAGCDVVSSIAAALRAAGEADEVMIMGGASFYQQMLPQAQRMVLTFIDLEIEGDAWFPQWEPSEWRETRREDCPADEKNRWPHHFVEMERIG
ncbi:MAG: type 3 dihydrofolate reductase [Gammaproteobacteria bacterium]|jgi:dihydrofolate reductase|nr:type 3 dihydrofolate reductase [Gammaproteobacteria bacterium]MBT7308154.1 type 3 dihydrofolate reductase [Gammaproteobacteria bacterium]